MNKTKLSIIIAGAIILNGCVNLAPKNDIPNIKNINVANVKSNSESNTKIGWNEYITDENIKRIIELAISNNFDISVAKMNIEKAAASYRIVKSETTPSINFNSSAMKGENPRSNESLSANIGFNSYEIDFFSKIANKSKSSILEYESIIYESELINKIIVNKVLLLLNAIASNNEMIEKLDEIMNLAKDSENIIKKKVDFGLSKESDHINAKTITIRAAYDIEIARSELFKNKTALSILIGEDVDGLSLPNNISHVKNAYLKQPKMINSNSLLNRPDIKMVEKRLEASNADIGVARANFYPSISLTTNAGVISSDLSNFTTNGAWLISPSLNIPIFNNGLNKSRLRVSEINRDILIEDYKNTIKNAFKEVSDSINDVESTSKQVEIFNSLLSESRRSLDITKKSYEQGVVDYLDVLNLNRDLYNIEKENIVLKKKEVDNELNLYKSISVY